MKKFGKAILVGYNCFCGNYGIWSNCNDYSRNRRWSHNNTTFDLDSRINSRFNCWTY